jgi:SAM-dependent methyltransferase
MARSQDQNIADAATFFDLLIRQLGGKGPLRLLDFGCGTGGLVADFRTRGYEAYGCDTWHLYDAKPPSDERLREIERDPYRIPFDSGYFDAVVSTSVFEHAQNKEECFKEIHRVLKPEGHAIHIFPAKWYLPTEPHMYVPFVSWFWPHVPKLWLSLWALLGVRNEFQQGKSWRQVRDLNYEFCQRGLSYWSTGRYKELSNRIFGESFFPMELFVSQPGGGFNALARRVPFKRTMGLICRECRMTVLLQHKTRIG